MKNDDDGLTIQVHPGDKCMNRTEFRAFILDILQHQKRFRIENIEDPWNVYLYFAPEKMYPGRFGSVKHEK